MSVLQCLEAEFYSQVAYGKGIYAVNSSLVGELTQEAAWPFALVEISTIT